MTPGGFSEAVALYHERVASSEWTPHRPERPLVRGASKPLKVVSSYEAAGDQPAAIAELVDGIKKGA